MLCESKTVFVNLQIYYKDSADFVTSGEQFRRLKFGDRYFYTHTVSTYFWLYKSCIKYYVYFNNNKVEQFQLVFLRIERLNENVTLVKNYGCKTYWLFCHPTKQYSFYLCYYGGQSHGFLSFHLICENCEPNWRFFFARAGRHTAWAGLQSRLCFRGENL